MALLKVENVTKRFGGLVAVDNVSFDILHGEMMAIVGPNGAGKTTMFNLINGVFPVDEGTIIFEDIDVTNFPAFKRAHLGIGRTFQIPRRPKVSSRPDNWARCNSRQTRCGCRWRSQRTRPFWATRPKID
jgi:ABC-type branched-subunit amino acid transport system ATPase component